MGGLESYLKLLERQRDRSIAQLLDFKERECDGFLPQNVSRGLRKAVLDQMNDFFLVCQDLLQAANGDGLALNEIYLSRIDEIHEQVMTWFEEDDN